jgi:hypothetical protein
MKNMKKLFILTILLLFSIYGHCYADIPYGNNPEVGQFYDIRGFKMYVEEYGKGQPLLLIHGNGGSINAFRKKHFLFCRKLPGHCHGQPGTWQINRQYRLP